MAHRPFSSLRIRLLASVVVAGLPVLGLVLYTGLEHRQQAMEQAQAHILRVASVISRDQQQAIEVGRQLLITLAQLPAVRERDGAACSAIFATSLQSHRRYTNLGAVAPDGRVFCSAVPVEDLMDRFNASSSEWFREALDKRVFAVSDYHIGGITGRPVLTMSYPAFDRGVVQAVVFVSLDLEWLSSFAISEQLSPDSVVTVVDRQGTVLAGYPDPEVWPGINSRDAPIVQRAIQQKHEGLEETVGVDGRRRLYAHTPLGLTGQEPSAYVLIGTPRETVFAASAHELNRNLLGVGAAAFVALLFAWWSSELFLVRRVARLMGATRRLAAGDLTARTGDLSGPTELNQLAQVFDDMAATLQKRQAESERAQQALRDSEARYRLIVETAEEGIFIIDPDGATVFANAMMAGMLGYSVDEMRGRPIFDFMDEEMGSLARHGLLRRQGVREQHDVRFRRKDGGELWTIVAANPIAESDGRCLGTLAMVTDITERKRAEDHLIYLAHHDGLTGLPNRTLFNDRLQQSLIDAGRRERVVAVLFMDLDRFKTINDTLGHEVGDVLLRAVSGRLKDCIRTGDTVARLGGDEFIVLLPDVGHVDDVGRIAQKILDVFDQPFSVDGRELFVTTSIGITLYPFDGKDVDGLVKNADVAMYRAKDQGRNSYQFYTVEMTAKAHENLALENALRGALDRNELTLHYQPVVDLASDEVSGMEALLRWRHPEQGLIMPQRFIPIAEESGLIVPIGEWALRTACQQAKTWQQQGYPALRLAVNLSARQFYQRNLAEVIARVLKDSGLDPAWLELELTESLLMQNAELTHATLRTLNTMGVRLSIDDFGTGYSSLGYLKRFPLDTLKISRSFVRDVPADPDDAAIVSAIIAMAHTLEMRVIAEDVETEAQRLFLRAQTCDAYQGYVFGPPLPPEEFTRYLPKSRLRRSST
ncbi:MAG: EAL domain-containing protein [Gammaproteobacteria bacterium]|nr:EAL domain-containing protein [Gammaproteobacteria bacterium]